MSNWDNTGPRNLIQVKVKFFNENIISNKDSGQIDGKKNDIFPLSKQNDCKMQDKEVHF